MLLDNPKQTDKRKPLKTNSSGFRHERQSLPQSLDRRTGRQPRPRARSRRSRPSAACTIVGTYVENESGAKLARPELFRLLADSQPGDVLLVEQVDRLSRLTRLGLAQAARRA